MKSAKADFTKEGTMPGYEVIGEEEKAALRSSAQGTSDRGRREDTSQDRRAYE